MKKLFVIGLIVAMLIGLVACSWVDSPGKDEPSSIEITENVSEDVTEDTNGTEPSESIQPETKPTESTSENETVSVDVTEPPSNEGKENHNPDNGGNGESSHEHDYRSEVVKPTCSAKGYTQYSCSCGYSFKQEYVSALGHNYTDNVVAATTSSEGYTEHTCTRCGHNYKDNYTEKLKMIYDTSAAVAVGNAYAQSMGATIDYSLGFDNAGYSFPVHYTPDYPNYANTDFQTFMSICIQGCVDEVKSLGEMRGHAFDVYRINCYIEYHADDNSYWFYVFYG